MRRFPHDEVSIELSVVAASQVSQMSGGQVFIFLFPLGRTLRAGSLPSGSCEEERRLLRNLCAGGHDRVPTGSGVHAVSTRGGFLFPSVLESGAQGNLALTPAQIIAQRQTHLLAATMGNKRYTLHSFRVGWAMSHHMDGTATDVLIGHVGSRSPTVASRFVGVRASAAASRGTKRSCDAAVIQADALPLSEGFVESYALFARDNHRKQNPY